MKEPETREELEKRMDKLARRYAETHDAKIKAEIEELSLRLCPAGEKMMQQHKGF